MDSVSAEYKIEDGIMEMRRDMKELCFLWIEHLQELYRLLDANSKGISLALMFIESESSDLPLEYACWQGIMKALDEGYAQPKLKTFIEQNYNEQACCKLLHETICKAIGK